MRHLPVGEQAVNLRRVLRGHYAYYGIAGNFRALQRVNRIVERYPLPRPTLVLTYGALQRPGPWAATPQGYSPPRKRHAKGVNMRQDKSSSHS
jgi:hypothetical protein